MELSPAQHLRMVADLLHPAMPELARRWLSALLLVPPEERANVVARVEARIVATYASAHAEKARREVGTRGSSDALGDEAAMDDPIAAGRDDAATESTIDLVHPPLQRDGYVEQVITTYDRETAAENPASKASKPRGRKRA